MKILGPIAIVLIIAGIVWIASNVNIEEQQISADVNAVENLPEPTNYAVDAAGALSAEQLNSLNDLLKGLDNGNQQIGVAIVETTGGTPIEQYGIKLAEKWQAGDAELDNGLIIILATGDRQVRIEIGRGLEGSLTDGEAGRIVDEYMIPHFKSGNWYDGITAGVTAFSSAISKEVTQ